MKNKKIITRFPPSPTGNLHIGNMRTALFNFLFARHHGGQFLFRLEDTDAERSQKEFAEDIIESLSWLGLQYDNKIIWRQSERADIYRTHLKKLVDAGLAYISKETEGERKEVIRFKNPNKKIAFDDLIRGRIEFNTTELKDFVIAKSLDEPLYHLAVVIDDYEMGITHIIRGEDHISNTSRQILLQEALGFTRPEYAHIPLILAPDRTKLSKRHGAVSVIEYQRQGYLPEAMLNFLALLGWNPGIDQELFSLDELIKLFDLSKVQKGGAIFNEEKLRWFNKEYLKKRGGAEQVLLHIPLTLSQGKNKVQLNALAEMLFERISVFGEIKKEIGKGEFDFFLRAPELKKEMLVWKSSKPEDIQKNLAEISRIIESLAENNFTKETIKQAVFPYAEKAGKGIALWPMRVALSGRESSPDPFTLAAILGKEETLSRLKTALAMLK